jgi:hypothetical protein
VKLIFRFTGVVGDNIVVPVGGAVVLLLVLVPKLKPSHKPVTTVDGKLILGGVVLCAVVYNDAPALVLKENPLVPPELTKFLGVHAVPFHVEHVNPLTFVGKVGGNLI